VAESRNTYLIGAVVTGLAAVLFLFRGLVDLQTASRPVVSGTVVDTYARTGVSRGLSPSTTSYYLTLSYPADSHRHQKRFGVTPEFYENHPQGSSVRLRYDLDHPEWAVLDQGSYGFPGDGVLLAGFMLVLMGFCIKFMRSSRA